MILVAENLVRTGIRQGLRVCVFAAGVAMVEGGQAQAAGSSWFEHEHGAVRLIASGNSAGSGHRINLGLQFQVYRSHRQN